MQVLIRKPELKQLADRILSGLASPVDLERANPDDVRAIKTDTGEVHYRSLSEPIEKKAGKQERSMRYVASDETRDRMGDIIRVKGWDLDTFMGNEEKRIQGNPQALWSHNGRIFPIGTVTHAKKGQHNGRAALMETIEYLQEGTTEEADVLWKLVDMDVIRAVSVGFLPIKMTWPETPEEREAIGLGPYGVLFEKQEQLELSNCTIPANPSCLATRAVKDALRGMIEAGQITEKVAKNLVELGEKRTIQVAVPEMPEGDGNRFEGNTVTGAVEGEHFVIRDGRAIRVKTGAQLVPIQPKTLTLDLPEDPRMDTLIDEIRSLREEVELLRGELHRPVARALPKKNDDPRTPALTKEELSAAMQRAVERL